MIVRCTTCNSAFAVDDDKVQNKKFAFTCPKCNRENFIDNRKQKKPTLAGPAIVDEAGLDEMEEDSTREEAAVITGAEDFAEEAVTTKSTGRKSERDDLGLDDLLLDEPVSTEADDLLGPAVPDHFKDSDMTIESGELPPPDDMRSDIPLDDLNLDEELRDLDLSETKSKAGSTGTSGSESTLFEELGEDLGDLKTDDGIIFDELEPAGKKSKDFDLDKMDDIDAMLAAIDDKKEIVDDFEPFEEKPEPVVDTETSPPELLLDEEIKTEEVYRAEEKEDDSITIDLDSLDIELDESEKGAKKAEEDFFNEPIDTEQTADGAEDESITIDLDTLDIDLSEEAEISKGEAHDKLDLDLSDFSEETVHELEEVSRARHAKEKDDEDITLDLESLDISLDESGEVKEGESLEEDEKITLEDAGLTLEELTTDELGSVSTGAEEADERRLSLGEIDPSLDMQSIEKELKEAESILSETSGAAAARSKKTAGIADKSIDHLEIDFDDDLGLIEAEDSMAMPAKAKHDDDFIKLDEPYRSTKKGGLKKELPDMVPYGAVNFSIDYSIKYSKIGALLRLFGLFVLGLIPHYLVFFVYTVLSLILGFINHIVVIATKENIEDFSGIHENTLRYLLSISASALGIVEEMPIFAGRYTIDYPLQMRIVHPLHSSRVLAFFRLSMIGILLLALPHLAILFLLSLTVPFIFVTSIFSVLITGGWPHILFEFMTRFYRYMARVLAFCIGIVDAYPRFKFD